MTDEKTYVPDPGDQYARDNAREAAEKKEIQWDEGGYSINMIIC